MIRVTAAGFDPGAEANAFQSAHTEAGAMVTFTGIVRSRPDDPISALILECYPALAENELAAIREEAKTRFGLIDAAVIHRYGRLEPGQTIMMVVTLAPHRQAAFDGAQFLMDYLKTGAPFWKQEETPHGLRWVEPKPADDDARARWSR
ncbi:molybdopterin synthase subunit MoaE [Devosia lucknowensis]|uniref:Molybdopterin synthase catalytic subunit n=1 Tax=Devosia lucknowensis TaxID=1096929 RepID=A0A1Y6FAH7_9HYPH|nr:molybdenum cofactor biosynthesis protein MoaE [Devosia lucknowensis]SMQ71396.1 molybdopterin synthase subunit MoaE [Devosia lucknowensis]